MLDDDSSDGTSVVLAPFIERGVVTMLPHETEHPEDGFQQMALNHAHRAINQRFEWVAIIDLDEYLWAPHHATLNDALRGLPSDVGQVAVPWLMFGSNGHEAQPQSVVRGFTARAEFAPSMHTVKSIVRRSAVKRYSAHSHDVGEARTLLSDMETGSPRVGRSHMDASKHPLPRDYVRLHHYATMSHERFMRVKATRGDVNGAKAANIRGEGYFRKYGVLGSGLADESLVWKRDSCHARGSNETTAAAGRTLLLLSGEYDHQLHNLARLGFSDAPVSRVMKIEHADAQTATKVLSLTSRVGSVALLHMGLTALGHAAAEPHVAECKRRLRTGYNFCSIAEFGWLAHSSVLVQFGATGVAHLLSAVGVWPPSACATTSTRAEAAWRHGGPLLAPSAKRLSEPEGGVIALRAQASAAQRSEESRLSG